MLIPQELQLSRIIDYILGGMLISAGLPNSFHRMSVIILIGKIVRVKKKAYICNFQL